MAKFILTNRLSGRAARRDPTSAMSDSLAVLDRFNAPRLAVRRSKAADAGRRETVVFQGARDEMERMRREMPGEVIVEEAMEFRKLPADPPMDLLRAAPMDVARMLRAAPMSASHGGLGASLEVLALGRRRSHDPLEGAEVHVFLAGPAGMRERLQGRTDRDGRVTFTLAPFFSLLGVIVAPYSEFWPTVARGGSMRRRLQVLCEPLPKGGPGGWWHESVGAEVDAGLGCGTDRAIRVGVIDSGCGPHPALAHVRDGGAYIDGVHDPAGGADSGSHGTHVCGTIGARGRDVDIAFWGVAPGVELHSLRVFPPDGGANQGDIADAIDHMVAESGVDVINMSLGGGGRSLILEDAVRAAQEAGVVCVCAAGNDAGPVSFPAAFPECVAVAAAGLLGFVPNDSTPALPTDPALFGDRQIHAADFTNAGPEIDCIAPGVGIIAPVPQRFGLTAPSAAMNGTSMASPVTAAALAIILARDAAFEGMARNADRARYARMLLQAHCVPLGLPAVYEGRGMPHVRRMAVA